MARRGAARAGIGGKRVLRFRHAHWVVAIACSFEFAKLLPHLVVGAHAGRAVDLGRDGGDLVEQRQALFVDELEARRAGLPVLHDVNHRAGHVFCALAAFGPVARHQHRYLVLRHAVLQQL